MWKSVLLCALMMATFQAAAAETPANRVLRLSPALDELIAPGTTVYVLATGMVATEGPMWRDGRIWVSDMGPSTTLAIGADGSKTIIARDSGGRVDPSLDILQGPNGMAPFPNGGVLICRQGRRDIAVYSKNGKFTPYLSKFRGKRLNSPNDVVFAADGALWFTDPAFSVPGGLKGPNGELPFEAVFRYQRGRLTPVITDLTRPNGIAFSPDGKTLYVSAGSPGPNRIRAYDLGPSGSISKGRDFVTFPANASGDNSVPMDGMKVDVNGNLWATGPGGVNVITPHGEILGRIEVSGRITSNVAFGGARGTTLFITGGSNVYRMEVRVRGETPKYQEE